MHIAMILSSFPEVSEKFIINQVVSLLDAGVDLTIYTAHEPKGGPAHAIFKDRGVGRVVNCLGMPRNMKARYLKAFPLFLKLLVNDPGAAIAALRVDRYTTVAKNAKLLYFGAAFLGQHYDLVHCHFGVNGLIGAYLKDTGHATGLVTTFHGSDINTYPKRYGTAVYKALYRAADLITANTAFTKAKIVANGGPAERIRIHPVGIVPEEYGVPDRSAVESRTILTVGRLVEKKGHECFLNALRIIAEHYPDARYLVAGDGHLAGRLTEVAKVLGIDHMVEFLGRCGSEQIRQLYSQVAVFVLPSLTAPDGDMEGQGLVLQEAQFCGVPVVSTLHNGIPDGVLDGETGYLVPEGDSQALADSVLRLFGDPVAAEQIGKAGHQFVAGRYDVHVLASELIGWYGELLAEPEHP